MAVQYMRNCMKPQLALLSASHESLAFEEGFCDASRQVLQQTSVAHSVDGRLYNTNLPTFAHCPCARLGQHPRTEQNCAGPGGNSTRRHATEPGEFCRQRTLPA